MPRFSLNFPTSSKIYYLIPNDSNWEKHVKAAVISNAVSDTDSGEKFQFITRTCCIAGIIFTTALRHSSFPGRKSKN
jgi:hypothetical protein